ncbi:MAG: response regulator [Bacteroidia bacterium]
MKKLDCILFIDDDEDDNFFHRLVVKEVNGAEYVKIAESGFEALDFLKEKTRVPQLIFLDINMPKMNGWEFLEEYRKMGDNGEAVIIMLTTSLNPADKERSETIPEIREFKTKPLNAETLRQIIQQYFG